MDRAALPPATASQVLSKYRSVAFQAALRRVTRFARSSAAPVLLQGESGTGKTHLSRLIHELSPRRQAPFQHHVLSTLDDALASSALFGHTSGAFTDARQSRAGHFVSANGGTLFLDEIGKTSLAVQAKLLHALEYHELQPVGSDRTVRVDVRIVAATNVDLRDLVAEGRFLPDLLARLAVFRIVLPPLRQRRADIPVLAKESLVRYAPACGYAQAPEIDPALMTALRNAKWKDNIRELDATIHRLLIEADGSPRITLRHCTDELAYLAARRDPRSLTPEEIDEAVARNGVSGAAMIFGVDRKTLRLRRRKAAGAGRAPVDRAARPLIDEANTA